VITYVQSTGELFDANGALWGVGYAGRLEGRNNPAAQHLRNVGPLPTGTYTMGEAYDDLKGKGPCVIPLTADDPMKLLGRSGFLIHGDNKAHDASHGCIILGPVVRRRIAKLTDRKLQVVAAAPGTGANQIPRA
jgi:hypothetical protein